MAAHFRVTCEGCGQHSQQKTYMAARSWGDGHAPQHGFGARYEIEERSD